MQHRNNYTEIEDFLADESFQLWVCFKDDQQEWEEWTLENSSRAKLVEEARLWLLAMKTPDSDLSNEDVQSALEATWKKIERKEENKKIAQPVIKLWKNQWFKRVAAVLVIGLLSG